jgi:NAD/NADP transhydrogenase beta subunit
MEHEQLSQPKSESHLRKIGDYVLNSALGVTGGLIGFEIATHTFTSPSEMNRYFPAFIVGGIAAGIASRSATRKNS